MGGVECVRSNFRVTDMGGIVSSFFGGGEKTAAPPPPPISPSEDPAAKAARDAAAEEARRLRANAGMSGNILTSGLGDTSSANIGSKTLLGS